MKKIYHDLSTRDKAIESIKAAGEYISEHAGNILGDYPSGLVELDIEVSAKFDRSDVVCVDVRRKHVVTGRDPDA
jgi:hypothetical protein|nr:MAG TPA: hypothetical protein [Caudoviricetes sp.]